MPRATHYAPRNASSPRRAEAHQYFPCCTPVLPAGTPWVDAISYKNANFNFSRGERNAALFGPTARHLHAQRDVSNIRIIDFFSRVLPGLEAKWTLRGWVSGCFCVALQEAHYSTMRMPRAHVRSRVWSWTRARAEQGCILCVCSARLNAADELFCYFLPLVPRELSVKRRTMVHGWKWKWHSRRVRFVNSCSSERGMSQKLKYARVNNSEFLSAKLHNGLVNFQMGLLPWLLSLRDATLYF